jgi:TM2 domain-containing membrane protein YozV
MTDPYDPYPSGYEQQPQLPGVPSGVPYQPGYGVEPYGFDQYGRPMSDKSKVVAGLLQLLLGGLLNLGGVGRLYAGHTALGIIQLILSVVSWVLLICLFVLIVPIFLFVGMWIWSIIDGIVMLAGNPVDGQGRLLRS